MESVGSYIPPRVINAAVKKEVEAATGYSFPSVEAPDLAAESFIDDENEAQVRKKIEDDIAQDRLIMMCTVLIGAVSVTSALYAIFLSPTYLMMATFSMPLINVPIMIVQRRKLNKFKSFRHIHNDVRKEVNKLMAENDALSRTNTKLEETLEPLKKLDDDFQKIIKSQNGDVDEFRKLVKENQRISQEVKDIQAATKMQNILTSIMSSDINGDYTFSEREFKLAMKRLKAQDVDSQRVMAILGTSTKSITNVINATFSSIKEQQASEARLSMLKIV